MLAPMPFPNLGIIERSRTLSEQRALSAFFQILGIPEQWWDIRNGFDNDFEADRSFRKACNHLCLIPGLLSEQSGQPL